VLDLKQVNNNKTTTTTIPNSIGRHWSLRSDEEAATTMQSCVGQNGVNNQSLPLPEKETESEPESESESEL